MLSKAEISQKGEVEIGGMGKKKKKKGEICFLGRIVLVGSKGEISKKGEVEGMGK